MQLGRVARQFGYLSSRSGGDTDAPGAGRSIDERRIVEKSVHSPPFPSLPQSGAG
jgi:hypothetical protein